MGSEVLMNEKPRFRVKALGEFEQVPGCPDYAVSALGKDRLESLCGGECYRPAGEKRKSRYPHRNSAHPPPGAPR